MSQSKPYSIGLRNVGSYQVSGQPWVTGSNNLDDTKVHLVEFPYVCKSFTVINKNLQGSDIRVHFASGSANAVTVAGDTGAQTSATTDDVQQFHYITVYGNADQQTGSFNAYGPSVMTFDCKCSKFYISNHSGNDNLAYEVFAQLTNIPTARMYNLTGSGITE
jgi:hypothetical protein